MATGRSPTVTTILLFGVVFVVDTVVSVVGVVPIQFVLSPPLTTAPWTVVTSVYAHAGVDHLVANTLALLIPGLILERQTTDARFHAFFVVSGAIAGIAEITAGSLVGGPGTPGVLGASGAVFALIGYLLSANRLSDAAIGGIEVSGRVQLVLFVGIALAVTLVTASPQVAVVAHFTGLFVGLVAGRVHLLRP